jgi:hypothetical protein
LSLAVTRLNLASALEHTDPARAIGTYRDALAVQERLMAECPEVTEYQRALGRTLYSVALLLLNTGASETGEARGHLSRAIRLHRATLDANDRSDLDRGFLRDDYRVLCVALVRAKAHAQAATLAEEFPRLMPDDPKETLRAAGFLGECEALAGSQGAGEKYARRAVELIRGAVDRHIINHSKELRIREIDPFRSRTDFKDIIRTLEDRARNLSG